MKKETLHPEFFTFDDKRIIEIKPVMPTFTGTRKFKQTLGSLTPIMTIPMYTMYKEGSRKRKQMEKKYRDECLKKYNEVKKLYNENVFVGAVFCAAKNGTISNGNISCKITKIFIDDKEGVGYVCYKASDEHIEFVNKENKKRKNHDVDLKPVASGKFGLITFISALHKSNTFNLKIIKNPNKIQKNKIKIRGGITA